MGGGEVKKNLICIHFSLQLVCTVLVYLEDLFSYFYIKSVAVFLTQGKAGVAALVESRTGLKGAPLGCWQGCTLCEPLQSRGGMSFAVPFLEADLSAGGVCM